MNAALTANHLIDWIWAATQLDPAGASTPIEAASWQFERDEWTSAMGFRPKRRDDVWKWAKKRCPELEYCRQLANASKHLECTSKTDVPAEQFDVIATKAFRERQKKTPFTSILELHRAKNWRPVLRDGAREIDLIEMLHEKVFGFWSDLGHRITSATIRKSGELLEAKPNRCRSYSRR